MFFDFFFKKRLEINEIGSQYRTMVKEVYITLKAAFVKMSVGIIITNFVFMPTKNMRKIDTHGKQ